MGVSRFSIRRVSIAPVVQFEGEAVRTFVPVQRRQISHEANNFAAKLVLAGAVMTMPGPPTCRKLVGDLFWENDGVLFWFAAFGDLPADARRVVFDETQTVENLGIYFLSAGKIVGYLSTIEGAGVDDTEDYRMAWKFWEQVAPLRRAFIESCYDRLRSR
jgi:hypothetical protein